LYINACLQVLLCYLGHNFQHPLQVDRWSDEHW
jgi:hypothetical protein